MKKILLAAGMMASIALSSVSAFAEEKVTVYTAVPQIFIDELVPMFEKQTGVNVEIIKAGSGELLNRLTAEAARPMADVLWSVDSSVVDFNPTLFEAYNPKGTDALLEGINESERRAHSLPLSWHSSSMRANSTDCLFRKAGWSYQIQSMIIISLQRKQIDPVRHIFNSQLFFSATVKKKVGRFTKDCWQTLSCPTVLVPYLVS